MLAFYAHVLAYQEQMRQGLESQNLVKLAPSIPLREQLHVDVAIRWLPPLLDIARSHGPARLAEEARRISTIGQVNQRQILVAFLRNDQPPSYELSGFFARVLLQSYAECLASRLSMLTTQSGSLCPLCGSRPQLAVLRPEGDGGKRDLVCSLCLTEWEFRRIICPVCEEVDPAKLPRYSAEEPIAVRIEACDTCKAYLKSFDMTVDGLMIPEVDEIATAALDLWATEHGYHKFQLNLLGF